MHVLLSARTCPALVVAACLTFAVPASAQGFKWWKDEGVQKRLSLSVEQSRRIDEIFEQARPALHAGMQRLESAEQELTALIEHATEDGPVVRQIELVEAARGDLNKTRTLMLLQMRRVLSPDQRTGLDALHHERGRGPRKPGKRSTH
ncbi:MAG: Spy/CpxP family protein refolding chaperone [Vicinamibacterales bacterium]